jgi:hypothetical protein
MSKAGITMILNEKKNPLSRHSYIEVPDKEGNVLSVEEFVSTFPRVGRYFDGATLDRCILSFYEKSPEKHNGQVLYQMIDMDAKDELCEIFLECGYRLDADDDEAAEERDALSEEQIRQHRENIKEIREGLEIFKKN